MINTTRSSLSEAECIEEQRITDDILSRLSVADSAATIARDHLSSVFDRLGVARVYGRSDGPVTAPTKPISGKVDAILVSIESLTDVARELRGLAETLEARL